MVLSSLFYDEYHTIKDLLIFVNLVKKNHYFKENRQRKRNRNYSFIIYSFKKIIFEFNFSTFL